MKLAVGTKNPAKVHAVQEVLIREPFTIVTTEIPSGVSAQPFSDEETMQGAINRARTSLDATGSELGIGLEGGVTETTAGWMICNWGALAAKNGQIWISSGAKLPLPHMITEPLLAGAELGEVMAKLTSDEKIRKKDGAIGYLTAGHLSRKAMFKQIVKMLYGQYHFDTQLYTH